ncbi:MULTISPECIES: hypothetical protein [Kamptonema]|uniref:hypothetical protein n=1 Tax=Kamptonema TaxID=1501433 RepID=UPI0001DAD1EF|nr:MULTISPECIES: hypothetical protein [Kamptonema]CBN56486.1 conserved exported hypothetical protein [Kamptonema sp. PCC 6506]
MRHNSSTNFLEIAEYISIAASIFGLIAAAVLAQSIYAIVPIVLSLLLNLINRNRLQRQTKTTAASTTDRLNQHRALVEQLMEQLKTPTLLATVNPQIEDNERNVEPVENLQSIVSAIKHLRQRENILEQTIKLVQAELDIISKQFKQRPELEQIDSLTTVILDLQQFINQLPQWGNLQQRQLIELQAKVENALANLSQELGNIPNQVESAVQRQVQGINQQNLDR